MFALKLHSSVLLGSPNCLAHLESSHAINKILKEQLGQPGSPLDRESLYLGHITESILAPDGSLCSLSNHIKDPFEDWQHGAEKKPEVKGPQAKGEAAKFVAFSKENKLGLTSKDHE